MQDRSRSQWHRDTLLHCSIYVLYNQIDVEQIRRRIDQNSMMCSHRPLSAACKTTTVLDERMQLFAVYSS